MQSAKSGNLSAKTNNSRDSGEYETSAVHRDNSDPETPLARIFIRALLEMEQVCSIFFHTFISENPEKSAIFTDMANTIIFVYYGI